MNSIKRIGQSIGGIFAWLWMLPGALWAHRKPGNKLGLPPDGEITLFYDPCPYDDRGPCHYASGPRCVRPEGEDCLR